MKFGNILKSLLVVAGPAAGALVGGPAGATLVTAGLGAAGLTKVAGKKIEAATGKPVHKVASPVAAVMLPALLAQFMSPEAMAKMCELAQMACQNPAVVAGGLAGVVSVASHMMGSGAQKVVEGR